METETVAVAERPCYTNRFSIDPNSESVLGEYILQFCSNLS